MTPPPRDLLWYSRARAWLHLLGDGCEYAKQISETPLLKALRKVDNSAGGAICSDSVWFHQRSLSARGRVWGDRPVRGSWVVCRLLLLAVHAVGRGVASVRGVSLPCAHGHSYVPPTRVSWFEDWVGRGMRTRRGAKSVRAEEGGQAVGESGGECASGIRACAGCRDHGSVDGTGPRETCHAYGAAPHRTLNR